MNIEEFQKLKKLAENNSHEIDDLPEALAVRNWLIDSERIDEGILGSMWAWMKRNLSLRSRKIHNLADEYADELLEEGRAEYAKNKSVKDLAAKYRAGTYNRLSRDIENRMEIIAGEDEDYRELVKVLVNKKNLEVKKKLIKELIGKADPDEAKDLHKYAGELDKEYEQAESNYIKKINKLTSEDMNKFRKIERYVASHFQHDPSRSKLKFIGYDHADEQSELIKIVSVYTKTIVEKTNDGEFNDKNVYRNIVKFLDTYEEMVKHADNNDISRKTSDPIIGKILMKHFKHENPQRIDDLISNAKKEIKAAFLKKHN